jgi:hypothetical protein
MLVLGFGSIYDVFIAVIVLVIFMFSLTFGFTILLIHTLIPRGAHHCRRGDRD